MAWPEMPGCLLRLRYAQVSADSADLDELGADGYQCSGVRAIRPAL